MDKWLKVGVPILVAVLLIFAAVAVTMMVAGNNQSSRVTAASYSTQDASAQQLACSGNCGNCSGNGNCTGKGNCNGNANCSGNGNCTGCTASTQGSCCDNSNAGVYVPKTSNGGGCCRGR